MTGGVQSDRSPDIIRRAGNAALHRARRSRRCLRSPRQVLQIRVPWQPRLGVLALWHLVLVTTPAKSDRDGVADSPTAARPHRARALWRTHAPTTAHRRRDVHSHHVVIRSPTSPPLSNRPNTLRSLPSSIEVITARGVAWPDDLDLSLAVQICRGESELDVRRLLANSSCAAAESFFEDASIKQLLSRDFDVALVDADSLTGHTLVDALYPLPHVHFLTYPFRRAATTTHNSLKSQLLESSQLQREASQQSLHALRARLGTPTKSECAACHVLTIVGHSRALHSQSTGATMDAQQLTIGPPAVHCVGSVLHTSEAAPPPPLDREWLEWADAAEFLLIALGSWGDRACSELGADNGLLEAIGPLRCAWKSEGMCRRHPDELPAHVRVAKWLPLHGLLAHRNCKLLVCHAGANSISEASAAGVPIVCLPIAWDQPANAEMVVELGVGYSMPLSDLASEGGGARLAGLLKRTLGDDEMVRRSKGLSEAMREIDTGAVGAAELVEEAASHCLMRRCAMRLQQRQEEVQRLRRQL